MSATPLVSVLFVCIHNAGRSQMAAGFLRHLAGDRVEVRSAGSVPGDQINPSAVAAMAELGIDISAQKPKVLTTEAVQASDYVLTMGCGDACPYFPGKTYLDWQLADPAGQGVEAVRPIRDEIKSLIEDLIAEIDAQEEANQRRSTDGRLCRQRVNILPTDGGLASSGRLHAFRRSLRASTGRESGASTRQCLMALARVVDLPLFRARSRHGASA